MYKYLVNILYKTLFLVEHSKQFFQLFCSPDFLMLYKQGIRVTPTRTLYSYNFVTNGELKFTKQRNRGGTNPPFPQPQPLLKANSNI